MFKLGMITIVLCKLFLLASTQETVEFCDNENVCYDIHKEDRGMTIIVNPFNLIGPFPELPENELSIASCGDAPAPEDPNYSGLIGATLGLIPVIGGFASWFVAAADLAISINESSKFYGCENDNLQIQLDRVFNQARLSDRQDDANRAKVEAQAFVRDLSSYKGVSSLDKQPLNVVSNRVLKGQLALTNAKSADLLGADIFGEISLILASVQLIQISKAKNMIECNPIVEQLVTNNIEYAIEHLEALKLKNERSKGDFECKTKAKFRAVDHRVCDHGKYECYSAGDIVYDFSSSESSGRHNQICYRYGKCCNQVCGPYGCHGGCTECCKDRDCPKDIPGYKLTLARNRVEEEFDSQLDSWWFGPLSSDPNDKGVKFFYDELKKLRKNFTKESATKLCMRGLDSSPEPSPKPCFPKGYICGQFTVYEIDYCKGCCSDDCEIVEWEPPYNIACR